MGIKERPPGLTPVMNSSLTSDFFLMGTPFDVHIEEVHFHILF
jgi:hypothetical protein